MPFRLKVSLAIVLSMLTLALVGPLLIPIRPLEDTVSAKSLADPDSLFAEVEGVDLHYKVMGEGESAYVLLHGFGSSLYTWTAVVSELAERGRSVAFDRPAFGLSERPLVGEWEGQNPYSAGMQVVLTTGLMDKLGIERAVLIGHSAGAAVALQTALAFPERVAGLVLVGPIVYDGGPSGLARLVMQTPQLGRVGPSMMRQFAGPPGTEFLRKAWSDPDALPEAALSAYRKPLRVDDWDKALWEYTKVGRVALTDNELSRLGVPTLIVTGSEDAVVSPQQSEALATTLPNAAFLTLEGCGHVSHEECPEAFLEGLKSWLAEQPISYE